MTAEHDDPDAYLPGYSGAIAMSAGEIANTQWQSFREQPGVQVRELWRSADGVAGLLRLEPGAQEPEHTHHFGHHHQWIIDGTATVGGVPLGPGAYIHFPAGLPHAIDHVGPEGCTMYFVYQRRT
jgi:quercetin dioxygenase-like cupin family protein